jgi:hypothetical protein
VPYIFPIRNCYQLLSATHMTTYEVRIANLSLSYKDAGWALGLVTLNECYFRIFWNVGTLSTTLHGFIPWKIILKFMPNKLLFVRIFYSKLTRQISRIRHTVSMFKAYRLNSVSANKLHSELLLHYDVRQDICLIWSPNYIKIILDAQYLGLSQRWLWVLSSGI